MYIPQDLQEDNKTIGGICNYYGGLGVCRYEGKYYWCINNWDGDEWEEITKILYDELLKHD